MSAHGLREWRKANGYTQVAAADLLGVSQSYLSLLEKGERPMTQVLRDRLDALSGAPESKGRSLDEDLYAALASLGYPGFPRSLAAARRPDPTATLAKGLLEENVDTRVAESFPWLARRFAEELDWPVLVRQAKLSDRQNRLGFVTDLALNLPGDAAPQSLLRAREELDRARLVAEATYFWDSMPKPVREWMRANRTEQAAHWNMLATLKAEDLVHAR